MASLEAGKGQRRFSREPQDSPALPLLVTPRGLRWTDDLPNCKVINMLFEAGKFAAVYCGSDAL